MTDKNQLEGQGTVFGEMLGFLKPRSRVEKKAAQQRLAQKPEPRLLDPAMVGFTKRDWEEVDE